MTAPMDRCRDKAMIAATIKRNQPEAHQLTVDEALSVLGVDAQRGLGEDEARARLKSYGIRGRARRRGTQSRVGE